MNLVILAQIVTLFIMADTLRADSAPVDVALAANGMASSSNFWDVAEFFARVGSSDRAIFFGLVALEMERCDDAIDVWEEPELCDLCLDGRWHEHV